ncbi:MAG: hypothetical protein MZW92_81530 [Comamonadaceae bacterium]|nr:hypothetical protein [Comamonadaceae bacterium]
MLRIAVIVCGILLGLLVAAVLIASSHGHVLAGLRHVVADPVGRSHAAGPRRGAAVRRGLAGAWWRPSPWRAAVVDHRAVCARQRGHAGLSALADVQGPALVGAVSAIPFQRLAMTSSNGMASAHTPATASRLASGFAERDPSQFRPTVVGQRSRDRPQQRRQSQARLSASPARR